MQHQIEGKSYNELRAENERLLGLFKELRAAWFKGGDLDKDHVSQEALRIFIEVERGHQQSPHSPPSTSWGEAARIAADRIPDAFLDAIKKR